jgi:aryl-alcohol dehydrogenase-like predicted oxidoreductase
MEMRVFGRTGMQLSVLGFGCGAVGGLMVRGDPRDQERTIARAVASGVNYFDTAVQYGKANRKRTSEAFCKSSNRRTWSSGRRSGYRAATSAILAAP